MQQSIDLTMRCAGTLDDDARIGGKPPSSITTLQAESRPSRWSGCAGHKGLRIPWVGIGDLGVEAPL